MDAAICRVHFYFCDEAPEKFPLLARAGVLDQVDHLGAEQLGRGRGDAVVGQGAAGDLLNLGQLVLLVPAQIGEHALGVLVRDGRLGHLGHHPMDFILHGL